MRLHAAEAKQLITTGTLDGPGTVSAGVRDVTASAQHVRDFLVVAAEGYQQLSATVGATKVNVWAPKADTATGQAMLKTATSSLAFFNQRYGTFDQPEMDVIASHGFGGGMEYPGVTIDDSSSDPGFLRKVVAHENAHQWFYSMVGHNEFDDPWLDESFATFVPREYLKTPVAEVVEALRGSHPRSAGRLAAPGTVADGTIAADSSIHVSSPMHVLERGDYFGEIYGTGARMLEALHQYVSDLRYPPTGDSIQRRIERAEAVIAKATGGAA